LISNDRFMSCDRGFLLHQGHSIILSDCVLRARGPATLGPVPRGHVAIHLVETVLTDRFEELVIIPVIDVNTDEDGPCMSKAFFITGTISSGDLIISPVAPFRGLEGKQKTWAAGCTRDAPWSRNCLVLPSHSP
jgi:hypothetical protein